MFATTSPRSTSVVGWCRSRAAMVAESAAKTFSAASSASPCP
ncbi:hypothetical protein [Frankia sp. KB5]|nr:hypothetical protein [Frankia sp. KB5]